MTKLKLIRVRTVMDKQTSKGGCKQELGVSEKPKESAAGQIDRSYRTTIERNRLKLTSILKGVLFCAMHEH